MKKTKFYLALLVFAFIALTSGQAVLANESEVNKDSVDLFSEEVEKEIAENMEPVSFDNPVSTYVTKDGITIERKLTVGDEAITFQGLNDYDVITPFNTFYTETTVTLEESRFLTIASSAKLRGSWRVGLDRYGTEAYIIRWNHYDISIPNGRYDNKRTTIPKPKGNPAQAVGTARMFATHGIGNENTYDTRWTVSITPRGTVSASFSK